MPPPAKIFLHMTAAPTKEIAMGTKINVFATTPHFNESANTATKPKNNAKMLAQELATLNYFSLQI